MHKPATNIMVNRLLVHANGFEGCTTDAMCHATDAIENGAMAAYQLD